MKNFKPLELLFMAILILAMCSCQCVEDWVEDQNNNDPIPYSQQALECGGAADVFGMDNHDEQDVLYTDTLGNKTIYHRATFTDEEDNQIFTTKLVNYEFFDPNTECFLVDYSDPNREEFYKLEIKEEVDDPNDPNVKIGLCHQHKECPHINGDCNFAANIYPTTPARIRYCDGDFVVGQFLGIVFVQPTT